MPKTILYPLLRLFGKGSWTKETIQKMSSSEDDPLPTISNGLPLDL